MRLTKKQRAALGVGVFCCAEGSDEHKPTYWSRHETVEEAIEEWKGLVLDNGHPRVVFALDERGEPQRLARIVCIPASLRVERTTA